MPVSPIPSEMMRAVLKELEQAIYNHEQWAEALYGTLICHLEPDQRDLSGDAHRLCRFGQWYYKIGIVDLERLPGISEVGTAHERMHQYAGTLLRSSRDGVPISIGDYERFVTATKRLRLEVATLQRELENGLYNLDPLTGTPSRTGMLTNLREQRELVVRNVQACTVAMVDLDHFKVVNDKYGHAVGDKVLVDISHYIMAHLRPYDRVFRYGGEEFLICLPNADLEVGFSIIDRLRQEISSLPFEAARNERFHVTASFGLALLAPDLTVEQSIDNADKALYTAKAMGRNRATVWDVSMGQAATKSEGPT